MKIINFKKKKLKLLTKERQELHENAKICYIYKEKFENKYLKDRKYRKVRDHCHYTEEYGGAAYSTSNLKYKVLKKDPIFFHNGSSYDYYFIIKEVVEEFKKQFTSLGENTKKYIIFTVPIKKKVTRIDKNGEEVTKMYPTHYNYSLFQALYQILSNNLSEGIHKMKCKYGHNIKTRETGRIKYKYCDCFLEYINF